MTSKETLSRAEARIGSVLRNKYRIDKVLGVGGMAVVYEVTHRNQKRFALKMLHVELSVHEDVRRRFLREGYAANTVDHPGAVVLIDDDTAEDGSAFLVMELLDGAPFDELLAKHERRLPAEGVLAAAEQALDVLVPAHAKGIIHRDIKPANLFVLRDGTVKMLDFGIARLQDLSGTAQSTHTGVMLGTPAYMPPEQALSQQSQIDAQTDLWSVGATMFTLLSGANVHAGQTATQILVAAASQKARSVTSVAPWVDERVAALVGKALAFEKKDRWPSAAEMRDAVRRVHEEVFGAPPARASLAKLIPLGHRKAANPAPFVVADSVRDSGAGPSRESVNPASANTAATVQAGQRPSGGSEAAALVSSSRSSQPGVSRPSEVGAASERSSQQSSVAFSTAKPVSSGSEPPAGASTVSRRGSMLWVAVAVALVGAGGVVVAMRGSGTTQAPPRGEGPGMSPSASSSGPSAAATPGATPGPAPAPTPAPTPTTPTSTATPSPTAAPPTTSSSSPKTATAAASREAATPATTGANAAVSSNAPATTAKATTGPPAKPAASARKPSDDDLFHP